MRGSREISEGAEASSDDRWIKHLIAHRAFHRAQVLSRGGLFERKVLFRAHLRTRF